ncbi:MAG TPA: SDR family oxidoreductase, partial [Caulobacterales bacterium]|nr:SDR family oxidoreductase [Caulobacterales bacterium]
YATYPSLKDLPVVITGGASGIGMAMVRAFAAQGAKVGFLDFDVARGEALAAELGGAARFASCDLRDIDALKAAFADLAKAHGPTLALVNNAARDDRHTLSEVTPDYFDERVATNLRHMLFAIQAVAPGMIAASKGSIINLGSDSWWRSIGGFPVYTTCKAAVHGLTRGMARELGQHRIRVNTLVPGWTMTERQKTLWVTPEGIESQLKDQCIPVLIEPEYIANMALFLAADDSALCTAQTFFVEGGAV